MSFQNNLFKDKINFQTEIKTQGKISSINQKMSKDAASMLSFILGNDSVLVNKQHVAMQRVNRKLILSSAMFWDSKKRVEKIKTLFLNSMGLKEFDDVEDFRVEELESIQLLSLSKNQIIHLQPIGQLTTLLSLNVSFNKIYDLNPLIKLQKLEELYASNNQIKTIESLKQLKNIKTLHLYNNKVHHFKETFETLKELKNLNDLDVEANPVAEDNDFIELISNSFGNLKKINGQLNKTSQKIKEMSSSKGFLNNSSKGFMNNTSMKGFMNNSSIKGFGTTSMFFTGSASSGNLTDPQKTFYDFCKKKGSSSQSWQKRKQKQKILQKLQLHYKELDEDFQKQIVKNVKLKNRLYKMIENKKSFQNEKEDKSMKNQQIKQLKRKVKALKQQLFTKDKKGELLRKLFEVELTSKGKQSQTLNSTENHSQAAKSNKESLEKVENDIKWTRRFQADDVMVIESNDKYLQNDMEEMNDMLGDIDDSIIQLKRDLDYLS